MRQLPILSALLAVAALAAPAVAADPAPKTKRICKAVNNGNPLFPQMKCHTVEVETAAAAAVATPAATPAVAAPAVTQVAANGSQPQ